MSSNNFEQSLKECIEKNTKIITQLGELRIEMESHHQICNSVKTVGTIAGTTGTGILVASVMAIPFTGGLSILGASSGLALTIGGSATSALTDVVDSIKTKHIIQLIQDSVDSKQTLNDSLRTQLEVIRDMEQHLINNDITQEEASLTILRGIANGTFDRITSDNFEPSDPTVRLLTTLARLGHTEDFLVQSSHLGLKGLEIIAPKLLPTLGLSSKIGAHTLKLMGRVSAVLSVATTAVDIALLIRDWTSNHPTIKVIDEIIDKIREENQNLTEVLSLIDELKERIHFAVCDRVPIIGATDVFTEIAVHLLNNESNKCPDLLRNNYQIDYSFKDLQIPENIALLLTKDTGAAINFERDELETIISKHSKGAVRAIKELVKNLIQKVKEYEKSGTDNDKKMDTRDEHIINNKMICLYREVIEMFVQQIYSCSFTELSRISAQSVVYKDFHNPVSEDTQKNIKEVMVARIPSDVWYINSNAIIYAIILHILKDSCKLHMVTLYNSKDKETTGTDHSMKIRTSVYLLNQFRVFVDEVALQYWLTHHSGCRTTFDESSGAVQALFHNIHDKLNTWVTEIRQYHPNRLYPEL